MKKKILCSFIMLFCAQMLSAQTLSIGPQAGFVKTANTDKAILMPGGAIRLNFSEISIECAVYQKSETLNSGSINIKSYPIQFTGIVNMFPYINLEMGIGFYNTKIDYSQDVYTGVDSETSHKLAYLAGIGSQLEFGRLTFTLDVRYIFVDLDLNNISTPTTMNNDFFNVSAGVMYRISL